MQFSARSEGMRLRDDNHERFTDKRTHGKRLVSDRKRDEAGLESALY